MAARSMSGEASRPPSKDRAVGDALRKLLLEPVDPDDVDLVDPEVLSLLLPLAEAFASYYLRMDVEGIDGVPHGRALIVGNHNAGITFVEPFGIGARWYRERPDEILQWLVHDAMLAMPGLRNLLIRGGCVRASHQTADAALARGRKVVVFPGGNLEAFRPYRDRYRIVFGGHKGFIRLALRHAVPIVPMVIVGGHESFYILHDGQAIARLLRLKKLVRSETCALFLGLPWGIGFGPIFHFHLPTKSQVRFLAPISLDAYGPQAESDPAALDAIYRQVTRAMQRAMDDMAGQRRLPILG
ncbi:MAG: acyltransferase family protein [Deltaproteobacteria bacterium]|nr:acyltransferase family protein [Deltaproteobacteria bacterium]